MECQFCGRSDLGNEGARTQHERACDQNPANQSGGQRQELDRRDSERGLGTPETEGEAVVDSIAAVADENRPATERAQGARGVLEFGVNIWQRWQEHRRKDMEERDRLVRNADLVPADEYPKCQNCDYQFAGEDVDLSDDHVRCPECGALYEIRQREPVDA